MAGAGETGVKGERLDLREVREGTEPGEQRSRGNRSILMSGEARGWGGQNAD